MERVAERIALEAVESSSLSAAGYNPSKSILAVQFPNGSIWHYAGVGEDVATAFYVAESRGRFYAQRIKGKFAGQRMTGPCPKCGSEGWIGLRCDDCGTAECAPVVKEDRA